MKKILAGILSFLPLLALTQGASAFDVIGEKIGYEDSKYFTLGAGLGFMDFARQKGIDGRAGFGFRLTAGHHWNKYLESEIYYQMGTFRMTSPDPIAPASKLDTRAGMNQIVGRMILSHPALLLQPYVSAGIGGYEVFAVNQETALDFPFNLEFPVGAGLKAYTYKNLISVNLDFTYQFLVGTNQSADTLKLLNLGNVSFDSYSFMTSFVFHFL